MEKSGNGLDERSLIDNGFHWHLIYNIYKANYRRQFNRTNNSLKAW